LPATAIPLSGDLMILALKTGGLMGGFVRLKVFVIANAINPLYLRVAISSKTS